MRSAGVANRTGTICTGKQKTPTAPRQQIIAYFGRQIEKIRQTLTRLAHHAASNGPTPRRSALRREISSTRPILQANTDPKLLAAIRETRRLEQIRHAANAGNDQVAAQARLPLAPRTESMLQQLGIRVLPMNAAPLASAAVGPLRPPACQAPLARENARPRLPLTPHLAALTGKKPTGNVSTTTVSG
jgi:hypothetical protein